MFVESQANNSLFGNILSDSCNVLLMQCAYDASDLKTVSIFDGVVNVGLRL